MTDKELIRLALKAAFTASEQILKVYEGSIEVDLKSDGSPLTAADRASHASIIHSLAASGLPVLSEEGRDIPYEERRSWKKYWLIDPLDGTKEFIKRNGEFTINIALMEMTHPVAGVICQPVKAVAYAAVGNCLYRFLSSDETDFNNKYQVNFSAKRNSTTVIASRSHRSAETEEFIDKLKSEGRKVELLTAGSALKFCIMAEGKADIYPRFAPTMEWDTAAGHALLKAAGKNIYLHTDGKEMTYNKPQLVNDWFIAR